MKEYCSNLFHSIKNYKILIAIIYSFLLIGSSILFLPIRFEENDDVVMLLLASGNYTGSFESNLVFINPIYGSLVSMLYRFTKEVEWYSVLFVFFHLVSFSVIIHYIFSLMINFKMKVTLVILLSVIELNLLMYLQFTTVSLLLTIAGVILLNRTNKFGVLPSLSFILLAGLIRYEAVLLMLLLFIPYFAYVSIRNKKINKILIFISYLLIVISVRYISYECMSKEWKEFTVFNKLRGKVTDNPNADFKTSIYEDVCSKEDYVLLKKYFPDPSVFSVSKMEKLVENIKIKKDLKFIVENVTRQLKNYKYELIILFIISVIVLISTRSDFHNKYIYIYVMFIVSVLIFISMDGLLKNRVFLGVLISVILLTIFVLKNSMNNLSINCISILFILLSVFYVRRLSEKIEETNLIRINYLPYHISTITDFFDKEPNKYLTPFGDDLRIQYINPFQISKTVKNWNLFYLGWMTRSPLNNSIMRSFSFFNNNGYIYVSKHNYNDLNVLIEDSTTQYLVY